MEDIMVSICSLAYNHEKYIRQALDGFVNQKTNFKYEILIHDDASTDGTADIIREYEKKYPDLIKPIYQTENQYSKGRKISFEIQFPRASGKYIAMCECDDYWTDEYKLQKQFDAMEQNPNCSFCTHVVQLINEDGTKRDEVRPAKNFVNSGLIKSDNFSKIAFGSHAYFFQTSTYFFKTEYAKELSESTPDFVKAPVSFGDSSLMLYLSTKGDAYFIDEIMSCYRGCSRGSWSEGVSKSFQLGRRNALDRLECARLFDIYTDYKFHYEIRYQIFLSNKLLRNFKELVKKENREFFKKLSLKRRIYYRLCSVFPWIDNVCIKLISMAKK